MRNVPVLMLLALCFGCNGAGGPNNAVSRAVATPSASPVEQSANVPTPAQKPPPPDEAADLVADFEGTSGIITKKSAIAGVATLVDVRSGRHNGFDRIVFEFRGDEMPGYHLEYIDKPVRACGSGSVVPLAGDGWLQMRFEPAAAHTDDGKPTLAFRTLTPKLPNLLEIKSTCDFEAQVEWVAGVGSPNRYRVVELKGPTRLAVDIKHK
jgi:hypothetical protein